MSNGLYSMVVEETTAGLYRCEASFGNWGTVAGKVDFLYTNRRFFDFGKSLAIKAGNKQGRDVIYLTCLGPLFESHET